MRQGIVGILGEIGTVGFLELSQGVRPKVETRAWPGSEI